MSEEQDRDAAAEASADRARVQDLLRRLPSPPVRAAFRERLRLEFAAGTLESPLARLSARHRIFRPAAAAAIAAAIAILVVGLGALRLNRGPTWRVSGSSGSGALLIDGREVSVPASGARIASGRRLELRGDLQLDLHCGRAFVLQAAPGSSFILPPGPGRWVRRSVHGEIRSGELRFVTGVGFRRATLKLEAPDAQVLVRGTTFAVLCEPGATCVCVLEGTATMTTRSGTSEIVNPGMRRTLYRDGSPPLVEAIRPMERSKLEMLAEQNRALLEEPGRP